MADTRIYHDTIVVGTMKPPDLYKIGLLDDAARAALRAGYPHSTLLSVSWTFATTVEEVEAWPLPHDCDNCRDGKTKAIAELRAGRSKLVALGDMLCEEPVNG
jgi:hypothetical protein